MAVGGVEHVERLPIPMDGAVGIDTVHQDQRRLAQNDSRKLPIRRRSLLRIRQPKAQTKQEATENNPDGHPGASESGAGMMLCILHDFFLNIASCHLSQVNYRCQAERKKCRSSSMDD